MVDHLRIDLRELIVHARHGGKIEQAVVALEHIEPLHRIGILFYLYAIEVINNCKNSTPDYWFAIVERVNKVRSYGIDPWNWCG